MMPPGQNPAGAKTLLVLVNILLQIQRVFSFFFQVFIREKNSFFSSRYYELKVGE